MEETKTNFKSIVRFFSPAWFAVIMGTGGLANALYLMSNKITFLKPVGIGMWWFNTILFILFLVPWIARWFNHFDKLQQDLKNPVMSNFFVTMPVGAIILATNFLIMGKGYFTMPFLITLGMVIWSLSAIMILSFGVFVIYNMILLESIPPEATNFSWFITPVASIVLPMLGNMLVSIYLKQNIEIAKFINIVDVSFFGIGLFLFISLSAILINRFISHPIPHAMATPTFWIILGPIGVGTVSLMGIADASKSLGLIASTDSIKFIALMLWGIGLWAISLTALITIRYIRNGKIPFSLSWWAFVFPTAIYTISSFNVYQYTKIEIVQVYAFVLLVLTLILWIGTFIRTLAGITNGKLLIPSNK